MPQRGPHTASRPSAGNPCRMLSPIPAGLGLVCPRGSAFLLRVGRAGGVERGNKFGWMYAAVGDPGGNEGARADSRGAGSITPVNSPKTSKAGSLEPH